jgi:hypothetical protein
MIAYEHTHGFTRKGCIVGARFITYMYLEQWFVCADCGGNPIHKMRSIERVWYDWAECAQCECRDFMPSWLYTRQCAERDEIIEKLPPDLRALFPEQQPLQMTADEAMADLFDL